MKCMKLNGKIVRVTDENAEEIKHQGYEFCPKSEWKASKVAEPVEEVCEE